MTLLFRDAYPLLLLSLLLPGCVSTYAPATPVVPFLDEAGDVAVGGSLRAAQPTAGASAFVAAAPTESTRVFVSGTFARQDGDRYTDFLNRSMRERNRTDQIEVGGGYGFAKRWRQLEALAGGAYGRAESNQCDPLLFHDIPDQCSLWVDSRSWFARPFLQLQLAARLGPWQGGGGTRVAATRYQLQELFGLPDHRVLWVATVEPFVVQRVGFEWGKLELGIHVPLVVYSPSVRNEIRTGENAGVSDEDNFAITPEPRVTLGVVLNIDELWRRRKL